MDEAPEVAPVALAEAGCRCVVEQHPEGHEWVRRRTDCPLHGDAHTPHPLKCTCKYISSRLDTGGRSSSKVERDPACPFHGDYFPAPIATHQGAERRRLQRRQSVMPLTWSPRFGLPERREEERRQEPSNLALADSDPEIRLLLDQALTLRMGLDVALDALTGKVTPTRSLLLRLRELVEEAERFFAGKWPAK